MASLPSDSGDSDSRVADELAKLRGSLDSIGARLDALNDENTGLRMRLDHSESARADLLAQTQHLIDLLGKTRAELRALRGEGEQ